MFENYSHLMLYQTTNCSNWIIFCDTPMGFELSNITSFLKGRLWKCSR